VTKAELVDFVASEVKLSKAVAEKSVDAFKKAILKALKKGEKVSLVGFGTFAVAKRAARTGRNPKTGEKIKIKASKTVKFKAGKGLKDAI